MRILRRRARSALVGALVTAMGTAALSLSGCGAAETAAPPDAGSSPSASADAGEWAGRWVLRYDASVGGPDGDKLAAVYLIADPGTGEVQTVQMKGSLRGNASGATRVLLVDAGHRWAIRDTRPDKADRQAHRLSLRSLLGEDDKRVDLGEVQPAYAAFDAEDPGILWVVGAGAMLYRVDAETGKVREQGRLPVSDSWIFTGRFDKNSGKPFVESIDSFDTRPAGNGELDKRPVQRQGGELLLTSGQRFPGLPDPGCAPVTGFGSEASGKAAWCVDGTDLVFLRLDGDKWVRGEPIRDAIEGNLVELVYALPPTAR